MQKPYHSDAAALSRRAAHLLLHSNDLVPLLLFASDVVLLAELHYVLQSELNVVHLCTDVLNPHALLLLIDHLLGNGLLPEINPQQKKLDGLHGYPLHLLEPELAVF